MKRTALVALGTEFYRPPNPDPADWPRDALEKEQAAALRVPAGARPRDLVTGARVPAKGGVMAVRLAARESKAILA